MLHQTPKPILLILMIGITVSIAALSPNAPSEEEAAVKEVAQLYIDGARTGKADLFNEAFYVGVADMKYIHKDRESGDEMVASVPIDEAIPEWVEYSDAESHGEVVDVRIIDDKLAHATIEILWAGHQYVDVMSMYKINGEWKIVNKTFVDRGEK
jgi:hypothetical protein